MKIVKSKRKSISIEVNSEAEVIIRAPKWMSNREMAEFVEKHQAFIDKNIARMKKRKEMLAGIQKITDTELEELVAEAKRVIPQRVEHYASIIGVDYHRITVRNQRTRWGSCSSKGNLNFNIALMMVPANILDYVVVHELCHRLEMNHSAKFWEQVGKAYPEYLSCRKWLKDNGARILARINGIG